ncbi:MAG TPA: hypothetical protein VMQ61_11980 [Thermoanaerobaculia bacterium]|nr:hypothetical protein [Thermoanaerobaculia bacterium]
MRPAVGTRTRIWIAASFALLVFPLVRWAQAPAGGRLFLPRTPLDGVRPDLARAWTFLDEARRAVPERCRFTVLSSDFSLEMDVFMMAIGLLPSAYPRPSSYYEAPLARRPADVEYVLYFGQPPAELPGFRRISTLHEGAIFRRAPPR